MSPSYKNAAPQHRGAAFFALSAPTAEYLGHDALLSRQSPARRSRALTTGWSAASKHARSSEKRTLSSDTRPPANGSGSPFAGNSDSRWAKEMLPIKSANQVPNSQKCTGFPTFSWDRVKGSGESPLTLHIRPSHSLQEEQFAQPLKRNLATRVVVGPSILT
jgi:hypothetical protein